MPFYDFKINSCINQGKSLVQHESQDMLLEMVYDEPVQKAKIV